MDELLPMEPQLLLQEQNDFESVGIKADNIWSTKEMLSKPINTGSIGRWKQDMGGIAQWICQIRIAGNLREMGYSVNDLYQYQYSVVRCFSSLSHQLLRIILKFRPSNLIFHLRKRILR